MSDNATSTADEAKNSAPTEVTTDGDAIAALVSLKESKTKVEEPKVDENAGSEEKVETEAAPEEAKDKTETKDDVLSQIDLDKLTEEQITKLAEKLRSKALSRYSELSTEKKQAHQRAQELEAELAKYRNPLETAPVVPKEYASIEKIEDLQAKLQEAKATFDWAEAELDKAENLGPNDLIDTEYGQFTKVKLKELKRSALKAKDEWIPAQYSELQAKAKRAALRESYAQKARNEIPWLETDSEQKKQYETLIKSPLIEKIRKAVPEAEADLEYVMAHAINSISGRKNIPLTNGEAKKGVTLNPPGAVKASAAAKSDDVLSKQIREVEQKASTSGSEEDFIKLQTLKRAKRI